MGIYGGSESIWWQLFDMLLNGGRATAAIALIEDRDSRPANTDESAAALSVAVTQASLSRDPKGVAAGAARLRNWARSGADRAERALGYASVLGQIDPAFEIAQALHFSRGFAIPDLPVSERGSAVVTVDERRPSTLFLPSTKSMRADSRFAPLVRELSLTHYWRETGSIPDYLRR